MRSRSISAALSLAMVTYLVAPAAVEARGGGGGFHGGGGGFASASGFAGGWDRGGYAGGNPVSEGYGMSESGNPVSMGYNMWGGSGGRPWGLEDSAEWSYEHPGRWGGSSASGFARGDRGANPAGATYQRVPQVSEADRVAAADQTYKWGFDRASTVNSVKPAATSSGPTTRMSAASLLDQASAVRGNYANWNAFHDRGWWDRYPNHWWVPGWGYGYGWNWATWDDMVGLMGLAGATDADYYDYGGSITYNNNNVYYGSDDVGTQEQYYEQAETLANSGNTSATQDASAWKPLGVYALTHNNQSSSNVVMQLAIDKNGNVGGNYYNELSNQVVPIKGKLDKKNQRVAFTVGGNSSVVYDTGLGNLLSSQAPLLVHFSKTRTEQWTLVRLQQPQQNQAGQT